MSRSIDIRTVIIFVMLKTKYFLYYLFFLISILLFIDFDTYCQNNNKNSLMVKTGQLALPLNKKSVATTYYLDVYYGQNKDYLCIEQTYKGVIDVYDLKTGIIAKTIQYTQTLLSQQPIGFFVNNFDSIYVLLTKLHKLVLLDGNNRIVDTSIDLSFKDNIYPFAGTDMPIIRKGDDLLLSGYFNPDSKKPEKSSFIIFNIKTNIKYPGYPRSDKYNKGWWGRIFSVSTSYITYNGEKDFVIVSFPIDNYIYVYDKSGRSKKYYAGSKYIGDIHPFSKKKKDLQKYYRDFQNYYARSGNYTRIAYDKYRNVYYRYVLKPVGKQEEFTSKRRSAIIVLDEKFNIIGEWDVPENIDLFKSFIYKKGLYIFNKEKYIENQDSLYFDIYSINKGLL